MFFEWLRNLFKPSGADSDVSASYKAAWDKHHRGKEFTRLTVKALREHGQGMMLIDPKDGNMFGFKSTGPERFYVALLSCMAKYESEFDVNCKYEESFYDSKGLPVVSRGLFQISKESANQKAYNGGIKNSSELHVAEINIAVAVKILNYWIVRDGYIGSSAEGKHLGGGRYWSVLREKKRRSPDIPTSREKIIMDLKELLK